MSSKITLLESLPILALSGWSGSGKTTLLEQALSRLRELGLRVALVKHTSHGYQLDLEGKDSQRLFQKGADVLVRGPQECFWRFRHPHQDPADLIEQLLWLAGRYDLVLVEGHKDLTIPKLWLLAPGEKEPPPGLSNLQRVLSSQETPFPQLMDFLLQWLPVQWLKVPLKGCLLLGGRSRRMGRPKHLIQEEEQTWLERSVACFEHLKIPVLLAGAGELPPSLSRLPRLPDPPGLEGPMAGILAALRWDPFASWLVAACDLPDLQPEALRWLREQRSPGVWAVLPRLAEEAQVEPLLACYDFRIRGTLEKLAAQEQRSLQPLARFPFARSPVVPSSLRGCWRNVNTPEELLQRRRNRP